MPRGNPSPKLAITVDPDTHAQVVAAGYALVSPRLKVDAWTKTETSHGELLVSCTKNRDEMPGQSRGG